MDRTQDPPPRVLTRAGLLVLGVLSLAQFLIALDYSIIYVALPSIGNDLDIDDATAQWVFSAYAVAFAGFLVLGGRLADRWGGRTLFVTMVLGFGAASVLGAAAPGPTALLVARAAQGLFAALLQPVILALIGQTFASGPVRHRAVAVWGTVGASGLAIGAAAGGLLTDLSWRWTFAVNVPLTLAAAAGALAWFARGGDRRPTPVPLLATAWGTGSVVAVALGLTMAADAGWSATVTQVVLAVAAVLLVGFLRHESTGTLVLVDRPLRAIVSLRTGVVMAALYMASVGSEFYVLTLLLQQGKGYDALEAGLAFVPLAVLVTAGNALAGRLLRRLTPRATLRIGFAVAVAGLVWLALTVGGDSFVVHLLPGILVSGLGHGIIYTSMFVVGTHDVPAEHQGTAGALMTTSQYLSGALAVAVLTLVLAAVDGEAGFRLALLLTAAAALLGAVSAERR